MADEASYTLHQDISGSSEGVSILHHEKTSEDSDNLDSGKLRNFIARALSESLRMSREAEGCREKKDRLRALFSKGRISQPKKDNSTEVLTSQDSPIGDIIDSKG